MSTQSVSQVLANIQDGAQIVQTYQMSRFTQLLMAFDQIDLNKDLQFKTMSLIKHVLQFHPHFITEALLPQFAFACLKHILAVRYLLNQKFPLQYPVVDQELQNLLNLVPQDYYQLIGQFINLIQNGMPQMDQTPYTLLNDIKASSMMTINTYVDIQVIIDYALTFLETYQNSVEDVLIACILLYAEHHNQTTIYLDGLQGSVSQKAESLREIFVQRYEKDLLDA